MYNPYNVRRFISTDTNTYSINRFDIRTMKDFSNEYAKINPVHTLDRISEIQKDRANDLSLAYLNDLEGLEKRLENLEKRFDSINGSYKEYFNLKHVRIYEHLSQKGIASKYDKKELFLYMENSFDDKDKASATRITRNIKDDFKFFSRETYSTYSKAKLEHETALKYVREYQETGKIRKGNVDNINKNLYNEAFTVTKPQSSALLPENSQPAAFSILEESEYIPLLLIEFPEGFSLVIRFVILTIKLVSCYL